jgi:hypothetical protein
MSIFEGSVTTKLQKERERVSDCWAGNQEARSLGDSGVIDWGRGQWLLTELVPGGVSKKILWWREGGGGGTFREQAFSEHRGGEEEEEAREGIRTSRAERGHISNKLTEETVRWEGINEGTHLRWMRNWESVLPLCGEEEEDRPKIARLSLAHSHSNLKTRNSKIRVEIFLTQSTKILIIIIISQKLYLLLAHRTLW